MLDNDQEHLDADDTTMIRGRSTFAMQALKVYDDAGESKKGGNALRAKRKPDFRKYANKRPRRIARTKVTLAVCRQQTLRRLGKKKPGELPGFFDAELARSSGLNLGCLLAFLAVYDLERYFLPFLERLEPLHVDLREMCEQVFAAAIGGDEAEALRIIEPFHCAGCHVAILIKLRISGLAR